MYVKWYNCLNECVYRISSQFSKKVPNLVLTILIKHVLMVIPINKNEPYFRGETKSTNTEQD